MKRHARTYRIVIEDEGRLREVKSFRFTRRRILWISVSFVCALALLIFLFFFVSRLSGIDDHPFNASEEKEIMQLTLRLDSLQKAASVNEAFLKNIDEILDTNRQPADSAEAGASLKYMPIDSLVSGSPAERRFVAAMGEKEKYNLQVLTPMDAERMIFSNPVEGGIIAENSANQFMVRMIVPMSGGVNAVADGIVLDTYSTDRPGRYTVLIQHSNGFVSRYSDVGTPLVENGEIVYSGQAISAPVRSGGTIAAPNTVGVELWHDGTPVYPADYIYRLQESAF